MQDHVFTEQESKLSVPREPGGDVDGWSWGGGHRDAPGVGTQGVWAFKMGCHCSAQAWALGRRPLI